MEDLANAEAHVLQQGREVLAGLLGEDWDVAIRPEDLSRGDHGWDAVLRIASRSDGIYTELFVEVRDRVTPKDVAGHLSSTAMLVRRVNSNTRLMVFSPWISSKSQEELRSRGIDYLDLTGNISLRISRPAIVIHTQGATRSPHSHRSPSTKPLLTGPRAGRLVRLLADVKPPYRATDLARHSGLSLAYVSRLLDALEDQLLVGRDGKAIAHVNWQELLRTRASHLDLMRQTDPSGMLAPNGVQSVIDHLADRDGLIAGSEVLVTGSYAAHSVAPIAVGGQLMLYTLPGDTTQTRVAQELGLLPVPESADVLLLQAPDYSVLQRPSRYDRCRQVGLSQLVLDCLSGPGRMPAEGEKVLEYMTAEEDTWRVPDLSRLSGTEERRLLQTGADGQSLF
ncbi:helix-turn-helix domain-containing protein [Streptomyces longhuiensis]|uniref:helix-turn-helix domain-containing protein n=1 Tax=Streptomyces longhuiensis TaxID=2880933 RepID=UPI001D0A6D7B|nr:helix-turn-helix domain-containing protein [Streptomyces longhuiensis]UDM05542.1 helix-turn-helix domain-containing protein [Streptomyces longhuiensis]